MVENRMFPTRRSFLCAGAGAAVSARISSRSFAADKAEDEKVRSLQIAMLSGSAEYHSDESLGDFAEELEKKYQIHCTRISGKDVAGEPLRGLEAIDAADLVIGFTRRLKPPKGQLE